MHSNGIRWLTAAMIVAGLAGQAVAGPTPAQTCQAAKNKAAGKYDACRQNAESGLAKTGDNGKYTAALSKCVTKYQATWPALEAKAVAQGGLCPSVGDQGAIQGVIDQTTTNIATALGGGVLQNCPADLATCLAAPQGQRLKTGKTTCSDEAGTPIACAGTGQDGELQKGLARSYTDNGDGTITDAKTGLMWEKLSDDGSIHDWDDLYTWTNSFTKIATLNGGGGFAGHTDWRLPNVNELQSLANYGAVNPAIDAAFNTSCTPSCTVLTCSCTQLGPYWSSSSDQAFPSGLAWFVSFIDGGVSVIYATLNLYVRAVRGGS